MEAKIENIVELTASFEPWQITMALKAYHKLPKDSTVTFKLKDQPHNDPMGSSRKIFGTAVVKFKKNLGDVL